MTDCNYDLSGLKVIVVERLAPMRKILRDVLSEIGIKNIRSSSNAEAAFQLFIEDPADLILTDWSPGLDGVKFLHRLRRDVKSPNPYVPVIVVTANTETRHIYEARDAGMTEFLAKPLSAKLIYFRIRSIIERQRHFVRVGTFFGPDRRRRKADIEEDRRSHNNTRPDRRTNVVPIKGSERRQGYPGYAAPDRREDRRA